MKPYSLFIQVSDKRPGWQLGNRVAPRRLTVRVEKEAWFELGRAPVELSDRELAKFRAGELAQGPDRFVGAMHWLELEVESSPSDPPRCVALRAPHGIGTTELRFPLAGIVTRAVAAVASKDGTFTDPAQGIEYQDTLFEADRARGRKRTRRAITPERLEDVAKVAEQHPTKPTAAVQHHFGISRGYARRLIKLAEQTDEGSH